MYMKLPITRLGCTLLTTFNQNTISVCIWTFEVALKLLWSCIKRALIYTWIYSTNCGPQLYCYECTYCVHNVNSEALYLVLVLWDTQHNLLFLVARFVNRETNIPTCRSSYTNKFVIYLRHIQLKFMKQVMKCSMSENYWFIWLYSGIPISLLLVLSVWWSLIDLSV